MKTYYPVRIPGFLLIILLIIPASLFLSCNKMDVSYFADRPQLTGQDLGSKVFSSVSGFVTNENDDPVAGAKVALGNITTTTDMYGYFEANDAQVSANAAVVTVSKKGYFNGTKTYLAAANNDAFFRIKLIPKTIAGSIDATIGGSVKLNNGMRISFPANGIIHASGGAAYNGTVNVAAFWINPVADDLNKILPGDQRGITKNGEMKGLVTYGMAAVELTDAGGELLQIAPGKNATITMPVPTEILFRAPASIPLWYFDEAIGLWKEQGIAQKVGNTYIGDVSHFSIWNYDDSESFVDLDFTAVNASGAPMKNALVKISYLNDPNNARFTYTDAHGHSAGIVPGNADLRIEIMGDEACGTSVYNQTFSTAANNISLGTITVNASSGTATVSGTLTDCSNNPVNNGSIIMQKNGQYYRFPVNKNGAYHFSTLLCNTTATVNLIAFNNSGAVYNAPAPYTLTAGTNTNVDLQACGFSSNQFINYTINGISYNYSYPAASFAPVTPNAYFTFAVRNEINNEEAGFRFSAANFGAFASEPLSYFTASQLGDPVSMVSPILVNITEDGTNDQVVAGNFSGVFRGSAPGNRLYTISCSFRIRCQL